jgi:hypothetical protein
MTLTVSPYLTAPSNGISPRAAASGSSDGAAIAQNPATASAQDAISLSPAAQQALASAPDGQKTPLQSALEKILTAIRSTDSPTLSFSTAPDIGKNLDQSC